MRENTDEKSQRHLFLRNRKLTLANIIQLQFSYIQKIE